MHLEVRDGKLWAAGSVDPPLEVRAVGGRKFYLARFNADMEFVPQEESGGMKIVITQPGAVNEGVRVPMVTLDADVLTSYSGAFWSEEMQTQYTVSAREGKLWLFHLKHGESVLEPLVGDTFTSRFRFMPEVRFLRDTAGSVSAVTLGGGRVTGVTFQKVFR